jgi:hypothetical protein
MIADICAYIKNSFIITLVKPAFKEFLFKITVLGEYSVYNKLIAITGDTKPIRVSEGFYITS